MKEHSRANALQYHTIATRPKIQVSQRQHNTSKSFSHTHTDHPLARGGAPRSCAYIAQDYSIDTSCTNSTAVCTSPHACVCVSPLPQPEPPLPREEPKQKQPAARWPPARPQQSPRTMRRDFSSRSARPSDHDAHPTSCGSTDPPRAGTQTNARSARARARSCAQYERVVKSATARRIQWAE